MTILGLSLDDVWLSLTSIPSIVIGCLRLLLKLLIVGFADICTGILGGLISNDWMNLSASFLLIYIRSKWGTKIITYIFSSTRQTSTHTQTQTQTHTQTQTLTNNYCCVCSKHCLLPPPTHTHIHTSLTTDGINCGVISHPWTALTGNPNNSNVFSVSISLVVASFCSLDEGSLIVKRNGKFNSLLPNSDFHFRIIYIRNIDVYIII